ncbi:MAG TPA: HAMP domain-containing sensor histidine kinase [Bacillota bacterium]|nr:HAMP domain-containing sensor histidine kinase [Bacillota bacterium]
MLFIAMFFLVFAIFIIARVFHGYQAVWLGLIFLAFGCCIVGLVGLVPRFSNYNLEGLLGLSFEQPGWAWDILRSLPLTDFMRFRLWSAAAFIGAVIGFTYTYVGERFRWKDYGIVGLFLIFFAWFLWHYDPDQLFSLFKYGASLNIASPERFFWEKRLLMRDLVIFFIIVAIFGYCLAKILRLFFTCQIFQKRIQVLLVGISNAVLCFFFVVLFCTGKSSILNAHTVATTLLPLGRDYPFYDTRYLLLVPFGAFIVIVVVTLSILRYGFLGSWRINNKHLDQQIHIVNQAVKIALHPFKNQFLGMKMAMDMAAADLESIHDEGMDQVKSQITWVKDTCIQALARLDVLQSQADRLQLNPCWLLERELWEEAKLRCKQRLSQIHLIERIQDNEMCILGDREHLVSVMENLLQNALDALSQVKDNNFKPQIVVEIGREYEWGYFRITDNGPGILKKNLHKIFQPFFSTKPTRSNWGLGLTYCHRVVKLHRGFINVKSCPGMGATFEVVLRCRENFNKKLKQ